MNRVAIEGGFIFLYDSVVTVDSHRSAIVRDRKGKNFSVELFLAFHRLKKFDKSSYGDSHAVCVLTIGNVESGSAALDFAGEEGKVHPVGCRE